jgi:hypothetical protein
VPKSVAMDEREFCTWYGDTLGYGYGTGDVHFCHALVTFLRHCRETGSYTYTTMQDALGEAAFWFFLNTLCHAGLVDYGTSPRYGWLSEEGKRLADFVKDYDADRLYNLVMTAEPY